MPARLVETPGGDPVPALARHLQGLVASGHWVLLATARTPGGDLLRRLERLGVDGQKLIVVDTVTPTEQQAAADPQRLLYMPSPALLELLALRSEKVVWARRKEKTHILVHDLNAFAQHSPPDAIEQMVRYILTRVRPYTTVDLCVAPDPPLPASLLEALRDVCDEHVRLT